MSVFPEANGERVYTQYKPFIQNDNLKNRLWDVIVVGSGIAGMSAACALSKYNRKVLLLEKHYLPGGYTHVFSRKGAHWDVGVHAIGDMHEKGKMKKTLDWLASANVEWESLGNPYDVFHFPDGFSIGFPNSIAELKKELLSKFPDEEVKIKKYIDTCYTCMKQVNISFASRMLPKALGQSLNKASHLFIRDWWSVTTEEILEEIGLSEKCRNVLTAQWGYYGDQPKDSSFAIHALILTHFAKGAYYPKGGSKMLAAHLLSELRKNGGEVVCQTEVKELIIENNVCCGVVLATGEKIRSKKVISAIPAKTSAEKFMPNTKKYQEWRKSILSVGHSPSYICLNLIFEGDIEKAGATKANKWFFQEWNRNHCDLTWDVDQKEQEANILYVSFPSLKDSTHEPGEKKQQTGECVTFIKWENVMKWEETHYQKRPQDYEDFKKSLQERLLAQLKKHMPEIMKYCVYAELSTPLTAKHFVQAVRGSIYGMDATPKRFTNPDLRTRTPLKNFYLSGVDVMTTGVCGGMNAGILTAASIEPRILKILL